MLFSACSVWWQMYSFTFSSFIMAWLPIGEARTSPSNVLQRLKATYTCPEANAACASIIACSKVNPWLLCMVIAHARRRGYCLNVPCTSASICFVCSFRVYLVFSQVSISTSIALLSPVHSTNILCSSTYVTCPIRPL